MVSLPKEWVRQNKIEKGSVLAIESGPEASLLIYPFSSADKERNSATIPYPGKYPRNLANEITGAYLLGYDTIRIQGTERISYQNMEEIKRTVRKLIGLEIVEEDARSVTAEVLLEPTTLDPEKIFRRMHMIVLGMHRDAITATIESDSHLSKVVIERDDEVDRLYFLIVRLIRSAVQDPKLANKFHLTPIDCLDYRVAANGLETIGDVAVQIAISSIASKLPEGMDKKLRGIASLLEEMQEFAVRAFLKSDSNDAGYVVSKYGDFASMLSHLSSETSGKLEQNRGTILPLFSSLEKIAESSIDIVDLLVPMRSPTR